ncbi:hypothetical protein [Roseobacter sp. A03A-229]
MNTIKVKTAAEKAQVTDTPNRSFQSNVAAHYSAAVTAGEGRKPTAFEEAVDSA